MSEQGDGSQAGTPDAQRGTLLTPEATAITAFTLAALALTGQGVWTQLAQVFFGSTFGVDQYVSVLAFAAFASGVVEVAALLLGRRALSAPQVEGTWSGHLARAAVVLSLVALAFSALTLVAGLLTRR